MPSAGTQQMAPSVNSGFLASMLTAHVTDMRSALQTVWDSDAMADRLAVGSVEKPLDDLRSAAAGQDKVRGYMSASVVRRQALMPFV